MVRAGGGNRWAIPGRGEWPREVVGGGAAVLQHWRDELFCLSIFVKIFFVKEFITGLFGADLSACDIISALYFLN